MSAASATFARRAGMVADLRRLWPGTGGARRHHRAVRRWSASSIRAFCRISNITSIFSGNAYIAVAAIGMSIVIITGHIDVSVGSLIGVLATIAGTLAVSGYPVWIAWTVPVIVGVVINTMVGAFIAYLRIPSIVMTLGMLSILKGGLISATGGTWISGMPPEFFIAQARLFGIPSPVYFMVVLTIIMALWMRYSATGRSFYAVGGNPEAARAAGLSPERTCRAGLRAARLLCRHRGLAFRHAIAGDPIDGSAQSRTHRHHRLGDRRRVDPRRHRHGDRLDACRHSFCLHRLGADFPQCLGLLAARGAGAPDPRNRAGRHGAAQAGEAR